MSVIFDESALNFLLQDPAGPIGIDLRRRSENIVRQAEVNAREIIHQGFDPAQIIGYEIVNGDMGLESRIGVDGGRIGDYLVEKDAREGKPFTNAVQQELHD